MSVDYKSNKFLFFKNKKKDMETMKIKTAMKCFKSADKCYGLDCSLCILNAEKYGKRRKAI
ncbi:MAG TPA: hypothetical protein PLG34_13380 [Spirochaetota bacterium]|nr:hypothetical protein [Spirochaetota bacterium]